MELTRDSLLALCQELIDRPTESAALVSDDLSIEKLKLDCWNQLRPEIDRAIWRFGGRAQRNGNTGDDLRQQSWLIFEACLKLFRGGCFKAYFYMALKNHYLGLGRRRVEWQLEDGFDGWPVERNRSEAPDAAIVVKDQLESLLPFDPNRQRKIAAFARHVLDGERQTEIAHDVGLAISTVHRQIHEVQDDLRRRVLRDAA